MIRGRDLPTYLYYLSNPITKVVYYIGVTNNPFLRYNCHLSTGHEWIEVLISIGVNPVMTIFDLYENNLAASVCESYIISKAFSEGIPLTNKKIDDLRSPSNKQNNSYLRFIESIEKYGTLETNGNLKFLPPLSYSNIEKDVIFKVYIKESEFETFNLKSEELGLSNQELMKYIIKNLKALDMKFEL